jgi:hypothetical protein
MSSNERRPRDAGHHDSSSSLSKIETLIESAANASQIGDVEGAITAYKNALDIFPVDEAAIWWPMIMYISIP